jgi:ATP synthase protein I
MVYDASGVLDIILPSPYVPRAFDGRESVSECEMSAPEPKDLRELGDRLDAAQRRSAERSKGPPPTSLGIAFRFSTEMVAALIVGGGVGYGIDWATAQWSPIHTKPWGLIVFFVLGAAAGILNVIRAAHELNAEMAAKNKK